jgi:hypothetical protein
MFEGKQIDVQGFQIPSNAPLFLAILSLHVSAGLTCVVAGVFAMLSKNNMDFIQSQGISITSRYGWCLLRLRSGLYSSGRKIIVLRSISGLLNVQDAATQFSYRMIFYP